MAHGRSAARFHTGLSAIDWDLERFPARIGGAGWAVTFAQCPEHTKTFPQGREVFIWAQSWRTAQRALNLIWSSVAAVVHDEYVLAQGTHLLAHNDTEPDMPEYHRVLYDTGGISFHNVPAICWTAAKASRRRSWTYAIENYAFSMRCFSVATVDLEPFRAAHLAVSTFPTDHVALSQAIMTAYACIECLGLELRASAAKPSRIKGDWNPPVKADLEGRLRAAGVSLTDGILWMVRGRPTAIHAARQISPTTRAPWSRGPVRDARIEVVDAIAYADWLRDRVAAHAAKRFTPSLSPYDALNVQFLARYLTLSVLGVWRRLGR